jgi:hypothetical protein
MRASIRSSIVSHVATVAIALWLCCPGSARAEGGGGGDLATLQSAVNDICAGFQRMSLTMFCPQLPAITQAVLEVAGLENAPPEMIRSEFAVPPGEAATAGNAPAQPPPSKTPFDLSTLTPVAFVMNAHGQAAATQLYDSAANSFFYAVTTFGPSGQPDTLHLFYEDRQPNPLTLQGQNAPMISLPLTVYNTRTQAESLAVTTLQVGVQCTGTPPACVTTATASGNFLQKGVSADMLGLTVSASIGSSAISNTPHLIIQVDVPLVVTFATDPAYFAGTGLNPLVPPAFSTNQFGFTPKSAGLLGPGASIGIAPYPAPACSGTASTPCANPPPATTPFGFCASLPVSGGLSRAVGAFLAIAADGETLVSAPTVSGAPMPTCP